MRRGIADVANWPAQCRRDGYPLRPTNRHRQNEVKRGMKRPCRRRATKEKGEAEAPPVLLLRKLRLLALGRSLCRATARFNAALLAACACNQIGVSLLPVLAAVGTRSTAYRRALCAAASRPPSPKARAKATAAPTAKCTKGIFDDRAADIHLLQADEDEQRDREPVGDIGCKAAPVASAIRFCRIRATIRQTQSGPRRTRHCQPGPARFASILVICGKPSMSVAAIAKKTMIAMVTIVAMTPDAVRPSGNMPSSLIARSAPRLGNTSRISPQPSAK